MKKLNRINKIGGRGVDFAVLLAVVAGWLLPVSAVDYVAHWDFGSDAQGVVPYCVSSRYRTHRL